jgi:hypothetical protein
MTFPIQHELLDQEYTFEDGAHIKVIQVKPTDDELGGLIVTYHTTRGPGIPQKFTMKMDEFIATFSHLFRDK